MTDFGAVGPLDTTVLKSLGNYVYGLEDPLGELFYVGRGSGDRCLQHARSALASPESSDKLQRIRDIRNEFNVDPRIIIIRYGLPEQASAEKVAAEVEAAVIDVLMRWKVPLTNLVRGAYIERGLRSLESLEAELRAAPLNLEQAAMIVNISRTWFDGMTPEAVWNASCCWWDADPGKRKPKPIFLLGVAGGIVRGAWRLPWDSGNAAVLERCRVTWDDLDSARQAIYGDPQSFKAGRRCRFKRRSVDQETQSFIGKSDALLGRSYGKAFRYWPPGERSVPRTPRLG